MSLAHRDFAGPRGVPVLVLHYGITRNWRDWELRLPELGCEWRVIAPDHRGHGDSARSPGEYFVADYVPHAAEFMRATFSEPITVLDHSLGAMVALEDPPFHTMGRDIATTLYLGQFAGMQQAARAVPRALAARWFRGNCGRWFCRWSL